MQNIYDDEAFFRGYKAIRDRPGNLNNVLDIPMVCSLLPDLRGKDVVDLGCGMGTMSEYAAAQGARTVFGVDLSQKMLAEAIRRNPAPEIITYARLPLEEFAGDAQFDVALSCLVVHYVADYDALIARIAAALRPGGYLVFSVEHPLTTAQERYLQEGERHYAWLVDDVLGYHLTVSSYVQPLLDNGLVLERILEPDIPADFDRRYQHGLWVPPFLYVRARKA